MRTTGTVIVLNGPSRAGKSTTAHHLQKRWLPRALVKVSIDDFMHFIPQSFFAIDPEPGHPAEDGFRWILPLSDEQRDQVRTEMAQRGATPRTKYDVLRSVLDEMGKLETVQNRGVEIRFGATIDALMTSLPTSVNAIAETGCDVVIEHAFFKKAWLDALVDTLAHNDVLFVGLKCPLEVLEEREVDGGGRIVGQVRGHHELVHDDAEYDLEFDTSAITPEEIAAQIERHLANGFEPRALRKMASARPQS